MDQNTNSSSGARGEEKNFGDDKVYKEALAQQFERLSLLTANHDEELKGIRTDLNRMMEYLMRNERGPSTRKEEEEVNMGNEDKFEEAYEHGNYQVSGKGFQLPRARGVRGRFGGTNFRYNDYGNRGVHN
ncbi:hypothetical protein GH714_014389 [Hevea brasiliensis]|uniref:Uncharacterized protein n=1 Tax=Hevea brasiliensis TaxID=3981 RepID=A0A6A6NAH8_HEVBR|nr:hypothetical protein GH714_014389 [Hevea brasiliensis]